MNTIMKRGFTLIELLVVIAIIGILAAVVLGSLNDARSSATDASAKTVMSNIRAQAEIYYNQNGFAYDVDDTNDGDGICQEVDDLLTEVSNSAGNVPDCNESDDAYAVGVTLAGSGVAFCIDSTGKSDEIAGAIGGTGAGDFGADDLVCP